MLAYIKLYGPKNSCNGIMSCRRRHFIYDFKANKTISNWFELNIL